mgnify:CR=1 FL=1
MSQFNDRFLKACRGEPVDRTPVWFMRQAGRYQAEYRALREKYDMMTLATTPELTAEVTLLPIRQMAVDAAILFSDIIMPLGPMGIDVELRAGVGPVIDQPIRSARDVERVRPLEPETDLSYVLDAIRMLREELTVPLIGFVGAPFTLSSYLVEGGPSKNYSKVKAFMYQEPDAWHDLCGRLAAGVGRYLQAQVDVGAQAVQVFDSWVGALGPKDYEEFVKPHMKKLFDSLDLDVPVIHFGVGSAALLELMQEAGGDVIGVDWHIYLDEARERLGPDTPVQGNLDPIAVLAPWELLRERAIDVLWRAGGRPGHIFNLGHGLVPDTDPDQLSRLVDLVHEESPQFINAEGVSS